MENRSRDNSGKFSAGQKGIGLKQKSDASGAKSPQSLRYLREKDREPVKGVFNFYESKGSILKFGYRKYKGDPISVYELEDGKVYTVPRGVAKHLNTSGAYAVHEHVVNEDGKTVQQLAKPVRRYGFQSLEFTAYDDAESSDPGLDE